MISITVPGVAKIVQSALLNFIYLDLLQTDKWLTPLLFPDKASTSDAFDDQPLNAYFDENGFQSKMSMRNLGSTFVYLLTLSFVLCFYYLTQKFLGPRFQM